MQAFFDIFPALGNAIVSFFQMAGTGIVQAFKTLFLEPNSLRLNYLGGLAVVLISVFLLILVIRLIFGLFFGFLGDDK